MYFACRATFCLFGGNQKDLPLYQVSDHFNEFLDEQGLGFMTTAAKCTKNKNVVITVVLPGAAHSLLHPRRDALTKHVMELFDIPRDRKVEIYADDKWHRVVINKIPIQGSCGPDMSDGLCTDGDPQRLDEIQYHGE
jgi:hypothetical protein